VKWFTQRSIRFRAVTVAFALYLITLALFTFFPRPVLETGDPTAIATFLQTHANFFYKILYANTTSVAIGNFFMLTPFIIIGHLAFPRVSLTKLFLSGVAISAVIEILQIFIPGRVSDIVDFGSNTLSLAWGVLAIKGWSFALNKRA
jgi:glycopeptide antibiotics resistance protein